MNKTYTRFIFTTSEPRTEAEELLLNNTDMLITTSRIIAHDGTEPLSLEKKAKAWVWLSKNVPGFDKPSATTPVLRMPPFPHKIVSLSL